MISSGEHWRSHRKLIAPAFHQNILKTFIGTMNSNSLNIVKRMEKVMGGVFDCHDYMLEVTVDILLGIYSVWIFEFKFKNNSHQFQFDKIHRNGHRS